MIQLNAESVGSLHAFDPSGHHTGPITDTTWEENIPGSSYLNSNPIDSGGDVTILLPKNNTYTVRLFPKDSLRSMSFSIYNVGSGGLLTSAFYDSIAFTSGLSALCTLQTHISNPTLWLDNNGDGIGDQPLQTSDSAAQGSEIDHQKNWNLVSLPSRALDSSVVTLFPSAISNLFGFDGSSYFVAPSLGHGKGYWLKFPNVDSTFIIGVPALEETVAVFSGWNLIGSLSEPIPTSSIGSNPPDLVVSNFFGYGGSYFTTDTILPGKGYWVKVYQAGSIIFSGHPPSVNTNRIRIVPTSDLPPSPPDGGETKSIVIPSKFSLEQNFPNPFNPSTRLKYSLPIDSKVTLRIYNVLGQEIVTLVNEFQKAGQHEVVWSPDNNVTTGIYYYRLSAGSFIETKKLVLLR
ncbi:MAG: T9SS type A sorting domain-containing protein [Ignavibacteria bacterium]|nr:T9SS type A sorting domain-containing protein [Ignavibacteria bacterium]